MSATEDIDYLKQFVKKHPDNRMAWYLLGKEYMLQNKEAKANYCFIQAGDVYEAFERQEHPIVQQHRQAIEDWSRQRSRKRYGKRVLLLLLLLLGLLIAPPNVGGPAVSPERPIAETGTDAAQETDPAPQPPAGGTPSSEGEEREDEAPGDDGGLQTPESAPRAELRGLSFTGGPGGRDKEQATGPLLYAAGDRFPVREGIVIALGQEGAYRYWSADLMPVAEVRRAPDEGAATLRFFEDADCVCVPADGAAAVAQAAELAAMQEERWTLASAILQYRDIYGNWPEQLDDLVRPYPDNVLAGDTPLMRRLFPKLTAALAASSRNGGGESAEDGMGGAAWGDVESMLGVMYNLPQQPLEIVVDRSNYRLAVKSGDVVVRSYPVGLGGDKTPEGTFRISEKVKNPNGGPGGEFGSRGMTLSDTLYAIHGTDEPDSIGEDRSLGCIRMLKEDVEELYDLVPLGTQVKIVGDGLPDKLAEPPSGTFALTPRADETNDGTVYRWLN